MDVEELQRIIGTLETRLDLMKAAVQARGLGDAVADGAEAADAAPKKEAPKMVAAKSEGQWPELPWGGAQPPVAEPPRLPYPT